MNEETKDRLATAGKLLGIGYTGALLNKDLGLVQEMFAAPLTSMADPAAQKFQTLADELGTATLRNLKDRAGNTLADQVTSKYHVLPRAEYLKTLHSKKLPWFKKLLGVTGAPTSIGTVFNKVNKTSDPIGVIVTGTESEPLFLKELADLKRADRTGKLMKALGIAAPLASLAGGSLMAGSKDPEMRKWAPAVAAAGSVPKFVGDMLSSGSALKSIYKQHGLREALKGSMPLGVGLAGSLVKLGLPALTALTIAKFRERQLKRSMK